MRYDNCGGEGWDDERISAFGSMVISLLATGLREISVSAPKAIRKRQFFEGILLMELVSNFKGRKEEGVYQELLGLTSLLFLMGS